MKSVKIISLRTNTHAFKHTLPHSHFSHILLLFQSFLLNREEAALHRAENLRLQDELRSCRSRLNSALDAQEDLLQKNAQKHEQIIELQSANASLRDELNSKTVNKSRAKAIVRLS